MAETWSFVLPGQPPSWNASYEIVKRYRTTKGGERISFSSLAKKQEVTDYQAWARLIIASAKPSGWSPPGQVRVMFWFYLERDIDCDNMMKAIHDAIEAATGVDDRRYLPWVVEKRIVPAREARVIVSIADHPE